MTLDISSYIYVSCVVSYINFKSSIMKKHVLLSAVLFFAVSYSSCSDSAQNSSFLDKVYNESTFDNDLLEFKEKNILSDEEVLSITGYIALATLGKAHSGKDLLRGKTYRELLEAAKAANVPIPSKK